MVDPEKVIQRGRGREEFSAMASLFLESARTEAEIEGFNRACLEYGTEKCRAVDLEQRMDEQEAKAFDAERVGFGEHQFKYWCAVPIDYITWYARVARRFLRWYDSDRVQRRIRRED